jgi:hypothetical protein
VEFGHVYHRDKGEAVDPLEPTAALHVKTTMFVQRLSPTEAYESRGWEREAGV